MPTLHFGKYKGQDIEDVPSDYLKWLAENHDDTELVKEVEDELAYRDTWNLHKYN